MNENTLSSTPNIPDHYLTVRDPSPPPNTVPMTLSNPVARKNTATDQSEWYSGDTHVPPPVLASHPLMQNNPLSPFGYPQTAPIQQQQQQNGPPNSMYTQPVTQFDSIYDSPSTFVYPPPTVETTNTQSTPVIQSSSPPPADLISLASPKPLTSSKSNGDNTATSQPSKPKSDKSWFGTLKRKKTKSEPDQRRLSTENHLEVINSSFRSYLL